MHDLTLLFQTIISDIFAFLKVLAITVGVVLAVFIVALALPGSRLRVILLNIAGGVCFLISFGALLESLNLCVDLVPGLDAVNMVGSVLIAIITGVCGCVPIYLARRNSAQLREEKRITDAREISDK